MKNFLLLFFALSFSLKLLFAQCTVPKPKNITVSKINSCSATIKWNASANAAYYVLWYKKKTGGTETTINTGTDTFYTVTGLSANTSYQYKTSAYCSNNTTKGYSKLISAKTLKCSVIENLAVSNINDDSALVSWSAVCGATNFKIRYRLSQGNNPWTVLTDISSTSFQLTSLTALTNYEVQGSALCGTDTSLWSASISFQTAATPLPLAPPNFVIILEDDGRYDTFKPTGGPSFFESPAINRLAYEGVNFKYTMPASSQCTPSRVSIYTGLYPHHHGALTNGDPLTSAFPVIQQILQDNGYYTGFVGKSGLNASPTGFNWFAKSVAPNYLDPKFNVNGITETYTGHYADISEKFALQFLDTVPDGQPFLLMFFTVIPHGPTVPRAAEQNLFVNEQMPFPSNFYNYSQNYPSYIYNNGSRWDPDSLATDSNRLFEFQCLAALEDNVDTLMDVLEMKGILDNTMVIFTSDNAYLKGEHKLEGKQVPYEESIRVPLFIRYPKWFNDSTVINDEMASNIDLAPTILEAAGIVDTFGMDGISLHQLAMHSIHRKNFLYEYGGLGGVPAIRTVRSLQYKYNYDYCNAVTEEFFDLVNDPLENNNLINVAAYDSLIQTYRDTLASLRAQFTDIEPIAITCSLTNPVYSREDDDEENQPIFEFIFPNPADEMVEIIFLKMKNELSCISIINELGENMLNENIKTDGYNSLKIDCSNWVSGIYFINVKNESVVMEGKFIVQHR